MWCFLCCCIILIRFGICADKNVLIMLADDAGFETGSYLNKFCQTPNLDALANRGLLFNNAFTSATSSSPSRVQLLTGLPSHSSGMYGLHHGVHNFNILPSINTLPNILREKSHGHILTGIIGIKNVGSSNNFRFDYEQTEEDHSINGIGRNITNIKLLVRTFLALSKQLKRPFFLVVSFHDPHRCGHVTPQYGEFCERWGSGEKNMGTIVDWKPIYYDWRNLDVPPHLPDTDVSRQELAARYMAISRLDQGVGLVLHELKSQGLDEDTLVMYTSDNGPPFASGRTNLYDYGAHIPFIMFSPSGSRHHSTESTMISLLNVFPTVLDVFQFYDRNSSLTESLLPLVHVEGNKEKEEVVFGSQNFHEITMYYPMRMIRTKRYKLIHNINFWSYFPIDQDLYISPSFQQILNATIENRPLRWYKLLRDYYRRPEWELFDIKMDPMELWNVASKARYQKILKNLQERLFKWQVKTQDPWQCAPHAVLQSQGAFKNRAVCLTLGHEALQKKDSKMAGI